MKNEQVAIALTWATSIGGGLPYLFSNAAGAKAVWEPAEWPAGAASFVVNSLLLKMCLEPHFKKLTQSVANLSKDQLIKDSGQIALGLFLGYTLFTACVPSAIPLGYGVKSAMEGMPGVNEQEWLIKTLTQACILGYATLNVEGFYQVWKNKKNFSTDKTTFEWLKMALKLLTSTVLISGMTVASTPSLTDMGEFGPIWEATPGAFLSNKTIHSLAFGLAANAMQAPIYYYFLDLAYSQLADSLKTIGSSAGDLFSKSSDAQVRWNGFKDLASQLAGWLLLVNSVCSTLQIVLASSEIDFVPSELVSPANYLFLLSSIFYNAASLNSLCKGSAYLGNQIITGASGAWNGLVAGFNWLGSSMSKASDQAEAVPLLGNQPSAYGSQIAETPIDSQPQQQVVNQANEPIEEVYHDCNGTCHCFSCSTCFLDLSACLGGSKTAMPRAS